MSQAPQYNKPGDDPDVLRLEEESDGSTVHVGSETTGSATDPPAPPRRSPSGKPTPIDAVQTEST
ncbi:MAG TPA: hypothetical protein PK400_05660, partial [Phycisphaerales bacterium]|nr:hypothetical protein [Phycisphaerales bacterium]